MFDENDNQNQDDQNPDALDGDPAIEDQDAAGCQHAGSQIQGFYQQESSQDIICNWQQTESAGTDWLGGMETEVSGVSAEDLLPPKATVLVTWPIIQRRTTYLKRVLRDKNPNVTEEAVEKAIDQVIYRHLDRQGKVEAVRLQYRGLIRRGTQNLSRYHAKHDPFLDQEPFSDETTTFSRSNAADKGIYSDPSKIVETKEELARVMAAIKQLPPDETEIIMMRLNIKNSADTQSFDAVQSYDKMAAIFAQRNCKAGFKGPFQPATGQGVGKKHQRVVEKLEVILGRSSEDKPKYN